MSDGTGGIAEAMALGEARYRAGAFGEAAAIFRRLSDALPQASAPRRMLGLCCLRQGDVSNALQLLGEAHALAPADPYAQLHYGMGLHAAGQHQKAAALFQQCQRALAADPAPFLNLAAALLALGRAPEALDAARRARRRASELPEAHYTEGLAFLAVGRLPAAAEAFLQCVRRAPAFADAWVNLGVSQYRAGNIEGAKVAMRQALSAAPGHRAAAANLGAFLRLTGEGEAGEAILRDLLARDPDAAEARLNLAADLLQEERASEALVLLDERAMPADPALARHWRLQRSLAMLELRRSAEARAILAEIGDVPASLRPLLLWRRIMLAMTEGDLAGAHALAEQMAVALEAHASILPEHRIMAHFDLAKFWSRCNEPTRAFPHWREGHRLLGLMQPFSRTQSRAFFDANIRRFDRTRLHEGPRAGNRDPTPIFIVGMPRSGTTLAEQIIGAHPQAHAAGERPALGRVWHRLGGEDGPAGVDNIAALDAPLLDVAAADYLSELHALNPQAARVVDKMPGNFNYLGLAALMLPGARIIHCVRDPRDIGLSIFTFRFYGYHPYAHDLADLGWYIAQHDRLMAHWRQALPNPILTLPLQDWVDDFAGTLRRVLEFVGLPYDSHCERFYEQENRVRTVSRAQVRQPVNANGIGRWRPLAAELAPLIEALCAEGILAPE